MYDHIVSGCLLFAGLSVTVINWSGVYSGLVFISDMVTSLANDLDCTVTETQSKVFQPVPTDQPHVDVICCWKDEMQSLKDTLPKKTASKQSTLCMATCIISAILFTAPTIIASDILPYVGSGKDL